MKLFSANVATSYTYICIIIVNCILGKLLECLLCLPKHMMCVFSHDLYDFRSQSTIPVFHYSVFHYSTSPFHCLYTPCFVVIIVGRSVKSTINHPDIWPAAFIKLIWLVLQKSSIFVQVHTSACNFLKDSPIYKCFTGNIVWSFGIYCTKFYAVISNCYKITSFTSKNW